MARRLQHLECLYVGCCYNFGCPLQEGSHPPYYCNIYDKLANIPDDKKLCPDCRDRYNAVTWGDVKGVVVPEFRDPMERVMECIREEEAAYPSA